MPVRHVYMWFGVNPSGGYRWITSYGWSDSQAVVWSAVGWPDAAEPGTKQVKIVVDQGGVFRSGMEGPLGRSVGVTNLSPDWGVIKVHALYDS